MTDDLVKRAKMAHIHDRHTKGPEGLYGELANRITALDSEVTSLEIMICDLALTEKNQAARITDLEAENARLISFANWAVEVSFDGGDLDGAEIQEQAQKDGLIETAIATENNEPLWEHIDYIDVGDDFYVKSDILRRAAADMEV